MNKVSPTRMPRRWFRFSLRTLFLLVTVLGVWLGLHLQAVRRQKESIVALKDLNFKWCHYDFEDRFPPRLEPDTTATSPVPSWLLNWLGDDFFHNITLVYQEDPHDKQIANQRRGGDLRCLTGVPKLRVLGLSTRSSDAGLVYVGQLNYLQKLLIWDGTGVSDEGVAHLSKMHQLKGIHIQRSQITDESLKVLAGLPQLEHLSLQRNHFTNQGLAHLREMVQLKSLWVGLGDVRGITDDGLVHLEGLVNLETLDLQNTGITTAGLQHLKKLKNLKTLHLGGTDVDDISELQAALPNCKINQ